MAVNPKWADQEARQRRMNRSPGGEGGGEDGGEPLPPPSLGDGGGGLGFRRRRGAARARRTRLKRYIWGGAAVLVAAIVAVTVLQLQGPPKPKITIPGLVTTYQAGEMKSVPAACSLVPAATLSQVMHGTPRVLAPRSPSGKAGSICNWTVDAAPVYRNLQVTLLAYAPTGLATGDGSATNAAIDAYQAAMEQKIKPPKKSGLPKATMSQPSGLGSQAFAALQPVKTQGGVAYLETVVTRVHNVLVTVVLQGSHTGHYGPVSTSQLYGGAVMAARGVLSKLG
jgi:hypothetical protein